MTEFKDVPKKSNGQLKYPIALMAGDEISFAGRVWGISLSSPYALYYTNSAGDSITGTTENSWWYLLSSFIWNGSESRVFNAHSSKNPGLLGGNDVHSSGAVRPVISLSSCVKIKSGNGTPEAPYEIDYDGSCNWVWYIKKDIIFE